MLLLLFCMAVSAGGYDTAKRDSILSVITGAQMPNKKVNILKYGAKGDGKKDCLPAFKKAMAQSKKNGGLQWYLQAHTICRDLYILRAIPVWNYPKVPYCAFRQIRSFIFLW